MECHIDYGYKKNVQSFISYAKCKIMMSNKHEVVSHSLILFGTNIMYKVQSDNYNNTTVTRTRQNLMYC